MDAADIASQHDFTEEALRRQRTAAKPSATRGFCLNCNATLGDLRLYCDEACREDHEYLLRIQRRTKK